LAAERLAGLLPEIDIGELLSGDADRYLATKRASIVPANAWSGALKAWRSAGNYCYFARVGETMKVARSLFAVLLATALCCCANYQAQQQAARAAQLNGQWKVAEQDCAKRFPVVTSQNVVPAVKCLDAAMEIIMPTYGSNQDLARTFMAQRLVIAEQIQSGKITPTEGVAATKQRWSEANTEAQRRNAIAQTAAAQQNAAAAQQRAAEAARAAADWQAFGQTLAAANQAYAAGLSQSQVRLQTTCMQMGNVTDCF
jgi:hypothetical protein